MMRTETRSGGMTNSVLMPIPKSVSGGAAGEVWPIWLILIGNAVTGMSFWLLGLGGMAAKLVLLLFWGALLLPVIRSRTLGGSGLAGGLMLLALGGVIGFGAGVADEKIRLLGNLLMLPVGLVAGAVFGRRCLSVMIPAMVVYLPLSAGFYITHEGWRLNQPFLFLGLFALLSVGDGRGNGILRWFSGIAVLLSQTRIAVLALIVNGIGTIRGARPIHWGIGLVVIPVGVWLAMELLPRLSLAHGSGRLDFWQDFMTMWMSADAATQWLGFGAGAVEAILMDLPSAPSFGALHNDHFRILFETGLVGAGVWASGWAMVLWCVRRSRLALCIVGSVLLTMVTDNTLSYGHYLISCGIAAGIAARRAGANG